MAFLKRDENLKFILAFYGVIFILVLFSIYLAIRIGDILHTYWARGKTLLESIGDGVAAIDRDWNIILWNKAAGIISGWSEKEVRGKPLRNFLKFIRERDQTENISFIEHTLVSGEVSHMENNTVLVTKDNREIPVGDSAAPIFDTGGKITGAIIVFRDVSKDREAGALRSDFAYASHQLRTPVSEALWNIELAADEKEPAKIRENIAAAYLSMQSVRKLVEHLVVVSELDQGTLIPKKERISPKDLLKDVFESVRGLAKERNVSLSVAPDVTEMEIYTDRNLLQKALFEVVENAVVYSRSGSEVKAAVSSRDEGALFEVRDSGIGIPQEQQAIVFTRFFRGSNRPPEVVGAGLGLFISREYVKLLGGKMWFKSEESKGTAFFIFLPIQK